MSQPFPRFMMWIDVESTGLPVGNDFSAVEVMEVAVIITDLNLNPSVGYTEVVSMTPAIADAIKANQFVREMHVKSGLIADSVAAYKAGNIKTVEMIEQDILEILGEVGTPDEFLIAGSGVSAFDFPLLKAKMPNVANQLAYFPFDIGIVRRGAKILAGKDIVNPTVKSYGEAKVHRALEDVKAHLEEAQKYRDLFRETFNPESVVQS